MRGEGESKITVRAVLCSPLLMLNLATKDKVFSCRDVIFLMCSLPEIIEKQTVEGVDAVTGATMSSKGGFEASKQARDQAKP